MPLNKLEVQLRGEALSMAAWETGLILELAV